MPTTPQPAVDEAKLNAFVGRMLGDLGALTNSVLVNIGDRLGLYKALVGSDGFGRACKTNRSLGAPDARMAIGAGCSGLRHL